MSKIRSFTVENLIKPAVFGASDGIITTFAVVASVAGARLPASVVIIMGIANMVADGLSMGLGDYLGERSVQLVKAQNAGQSVPAPAWQTSVVTFASFIFAGLFPLVPYLSFYIGIMVPAENQFLLSLIATACAMFFIGSLRSIVIKRPWWKNGLEMLFVGSLAAVVAYLFGYLIDQVVLK